ncbi:MAG: hypothetical protein PHE67_03260 [Campylobacterales bacterium]|nr:hypothetical protein [Campylobacterales bacterium]
MQKRFLKIALIGAVFASTAFASGSDLLSKATDGALVMSNNANAQALSENEMKVVVGGMWHHDKNGDTLVKNQGSIVYKQVYGTLDANENYQGKPTLIYGRYMVSNGSGSAWLAFYENGVWKQPFNTEAMRLTTLYKNDAITAARNLPNYLLK